MERVNVTSALVDWYTALRTKAWVQPASEIPFHQLTCLLPVPLMAASAFLPAVSEPISPPKLAAVRGALPR